MTDIDVAWAAGLFEGEGCLTRYANGSAQLSLGMTDEDVVRRFAAIFDLKVYGPYTSKREGRKQWWQVNLYGDRLRDVVGLLWPHLGMRRRERAAELGLAP